MIATVPTSTTATVAGPLTVESMGVVRRRRSTADRLDALSRLESERSRLVRQSEWRADRTHRGHAATHGTPIASS